MTFPSGWAAGAVTVLGLGFALAAAGLGVWGRLPEAFALLVAAGLADLFDGWVARRTGVAGRPLGLQLDSLVDAASFGVVPVVLLFAVTAGPPAQVSLPGLLVAWIYGSCAIFRLARFNTEAPKTGMPVKSYRGLPVTYAALVFPVVFAVAESIVPAGTGTLLCLAALAQAVLFVSPVPVPKPRGLAYPLFLVLALAVGGYLLFGLGPGVGP